MDTSLIAVNNSNTIIGTGKSSHLCNKRKPSTASFRTKFPGMGKPLIASISSGFKDNSHLSFYCKASGGIQITKDDSTKMNRECSKKESKKLKRLRELRKDLSAFSQSAIEYNLDPPSMEAIDLLMKRLEQLQLETEESMAEKKKYAKTGDDSSSSESSDSEDEDDCRVSTCGRRKPQLTNKSIDPNAQLNRIEVCTGGKCRKSGSMAVMEELTNSERITYPVMASKCMGKCKTAPNVKVFTSSNDTNEVNSVVQNLLAKNAV